MISNFLIPPQQVIKIQWAAHDLPINQVDNRGVSLT